MAIDHLMGFGVIEVDWDAASPNSTLQIRDLDGREVLGEQVLLQDLRPQNC